MTTFEELAKMAQTSRNPCGKQGYSLSSAKNAAAIRNRYRHAGKTWYLHPCYLGCGNEIFHLTTHAPDTKKNIRLNKDIEKTRFTPGKRARKNRRWEKNRAQQELLSIAVWQDDGGALHPSERED